MMVTRTDRQTDGAPGGTNEMMGSRTRGLAASYIIAQRSVWRGVFRERANPRARKEKKTKEKEERNIKRKKTEDDRNKHCNN